MRYLYPPEPRPTIAQKAKESQSVTLFAAFPVEILNVSLVPVADPAARIRDVSLVPTSAAPGSAVNVSSRR